MRETVAYEDAAKAYAFAMDLGESERQALHDPDAFFDPSVTAAEFGTDAELIASHVESGAVSVEEAVALVEQYLRYVAADAE